MLRFQLWCVWIFFLFRHGEMVPGHRSAFLLSSGGQKPDLQYTTTDGLIRGATAGPRKPACLSWCVSCSYWSWISGGCSLAANWAPSVVPTHFWFLMRKSGFLTLLGWPGRASEVSPEPWQSNPAPSSSESQLLSEEDLLPPWSCEWGRQAARKERSEEVIYD